MCNIGSNGLSNKSKLERGLEGLLRGRCSMRARGFLLPCPLQMFREWKLLASTWCWTVDTLLMEHVNLVVRSLRWDVDADWWGTGELGEAAAELGSSPSQSILCAA